jgi:hypothetical protein
MSSENKTGRLTKTPKLSLQDYWVVNDSDKTYHSAVAIIISRLLVKKHLADRQLAYRYLPNRHLTETMFEQKLGQVFNSKCGPAFICHT